MTPDHFSPAQTIWLAANDRPRIEDASKGIGRQTTWYPDNEPLPFGDAKSTAPPASPQEVIPLDSASRLMVGATEPRPESGSSTLVHPTLVPARHQFHRQACRKITRGPMCRRAEGHEGDCSPARGRPVTRIGVS